MVQLYFLLNLGSMRFTQNTYILRDCTKIPVHFQTGICPYYDKYLPPEKCHLQKSVTEKQTDRIQASTYR